MILLIVALGALVFTSCNQDEDFLEAGKNKDIQTNPINNNNPFNVIGLTHNSILNQMGDSISSNLRTATSDGNVTDAELKDIVYRLVPITSNILTHDYSVSTSEASMKNEIETIVGNLVIDSSNLSEDLRGIILTAQDYDQVINGICKIEDNILAQCNNGDTSAIYDLYYVTMFKFSFMYWYDALTNSSNPWNSFLTLAYVNNSLTYFPYKEGFLANIWNSIKNFTTSACNWVGNHIGNIVTAAAGMVIGDVAGALASYYGTDFTPYGPVSMVDVFAGTVSPMISNVTIGVACGMSAFFSATGACAGWTNPWF